MTKQEKKEFNKKIETLFLNMEHFITPYDEKKFEKFVLNELDNQRKKIVEMLKKKKKIIDYSKVNAPEEWRANPYNVKNHNYNQIIGNIIKEIKKQ